jgi:hypothetical protein
MQKNDEDIEVLTSLMHIYRKWFKSWFLAALTMQQIFCLHPASSRAASRFTSRSDASQAVGSLLGNHCRD